MIYLRTGSNGSCKTLFTLADVRKLQLESGRPVCTNGRFKMKPEKMLEFGWKVIDFKDWQAEPDGTIFLIDECHNDLPVRSTSAAVPEPVRMLAEHRARGFDFFLLTQHPMNMDAFVRKLIGAPGYHQHLKRVLGGSQVTRVLQWDAVNTNCEKDGSGKSAQIVTRTQPKEVFEWYDSASLHTAKIRIPKQLIVLAICLVVVPVLAYMGYRQMHRIGGPAAAPAAPGGVLAPVGGGGGGEGKKVLTVAEYVEQYQARVPGLAYTAARYDDATKPVHVPYPAACVHMGERCSCYTDQATKLDVPASLCREIVRGGFYQDWDSAVQQARTGPPPASVSEPIPIRQQVAMEVPHQSVAPQGEPQYVHTRALAVH